jgi:hypothetical protein
MAQFSLKQFLVKRPAERLSMLVLGTSLVAGIALPAWAQAAGDIVVIGGSPNQWGRNQMHWNQLMGLTRPKPDANAKGDKPGTTAAADPQALARNVQVSNVRLVPIIGLSGSSQIAGTVTNRNPKAVTITGISFQVFDAQGNLLQTGSVVPQPATVGAGQSVTFQQTLTTVPADAGATVRLGTQAVSVQ